MEQLFPQMNFPEIFVSFALGATFSWIVTHVYFRRSVTKHLSIRAKSAFRVFEELGDGGAGSILEVRHGKTNVKDLFLLDLEIMNRGDRPIRDPITPLTFRFPSPCKLLETFVLRSTPENRNLEVKVSENEIGTVVQYYFNLLNKNEGFSCRLLFDGQIDIQNLAADITADELPPTIKVRTGAATTKTQPQMDIPASVGLSAIAFLCGIPLLATGIAVAFNDLPFKVLGWRLPFGLEAMLSAGAVFAILFGVALTIAGFVCVYICFKLLANRVMALPDEFIDYLNRRSPDR